MHQRKRKYLLSLVVIGSVMMLSFRDTASFVHTFLHQFSNPFHHHGTDNLAFYHHDNDPRHAFFGHGNGHMHSLDDHVHHSKTDKHLKSEQKDNSEKKEIEKSLKTNLFFEEPTVFVLSLGTCPKSKMGLFVNAFFYRTQPTPPGPPPELGA